jgi:hypothetical protein
MAGWILRDHVVGRPLATEQLPGITANRVRHAYDWGLFEISRPQPNRAVHPSGEELNPASSSDTFHPILNAQKPHFQDITSDPVLLLGGTSGTRRGELSRSTARIWLADSEDFVDAYVMETDGTYGKAN